MSLLSVNLAIINLEGALYGIFFALSIASICLLVNRRAKEVACDTIGPVKWFSVARDLCQSTLFVTSLLFFFVVTAHWFIGVRRTFSAFIYSDDGRRPAEYFGNLALPLQLARMALAEFSMLLGDLILIHRAWVVSGRRSWIPVLPVVTICTFIVTGIFILHKFSLDSPTDNVYAHNTRGWIICFFVSTLLTRGYGTVIVWHKMYAVRRSLKGTSLQSSGRNALGVLMMFIESAAFSTAWTLVFAISNLAGSMLQLLVISCSPAINGIGFMLIIVRIGLGWDLQLYTEDTTQVPTLSPIHAHSIRPILLEVSHTIEQETDYALRSESSCKRPESSASDAS